MHSRRPPQVASFLGDEATAAQAADGLKRAVAGLAAQQREPLEAPPCKRACDHALACVWQSEREQAVAAALA